MELINTVFSQGHGPYVRTAELALLTARELEAHGRTAPQVIVPLVYGDRQIQILKEQFAAELLENPDCILLDEAAGKIIYEAFFKSGQFNDHLRFLLKSQQGLEEKLQTHLSGDLELKTLNGEEVKAKGSDIILTIARDASLHAGTNTINSTCGFLSEIYARTIATHDVGLAQSFDFETLERAVQLHTTLEQKHMLDLLNEPFAFSFDAERRPWRNEIFTPPMTSVPLPDTEQIPEGMYVSVTGIEGVANFVLDAAKQFNLKLYCPPKIKALLGADNTRIPEFISNPNIKYVLSRGGWGAGWLALLAGKPWIVTPYANGDDLEMYFVEKTINSLGLGIVFDARRTVQKLLHEADAMRPNIKNINALLQKTYGTRDGISYMSRIIADQLLGRSLNSYRRRGPALQGYRKQ